MSKPTIVRMGDYTKLISSGSTPLGGSQVYLKNGPVLFIRSQNVQMNRLDLGEPAYISEEIDADMSRTRVRKGDVLLNITGASIGRVAVFDLDARANVNQHVCIIRTDPAQLDPKYLTHFISHSRFQSFIQGAQVGGTRQALTFSRIADFNIPMLPISEQRRIAAILAKADDLRVNRRDAFTKFDSLLRSIFFDMFGDPVRNEKKWPRVALGDLLEAIESGWSPVCLDRPATDSEWGVLKLGAVTWCIYDDTEQKALPAGVEPRPELEVKSGDLLFTRKNTYELVAATAYVRATRPNLMLSDLIFRLRLLRNAPVEPEFLQKLLVNPSKRRQIQKLASGSAGSMPNISKARLSTTAIELPPVELQREFARRLSAIERLRSTSERSLGILDSLFDSLEHRAFRGEL